MHIGIPPALIDEGLAVSFQANYSYDGFVPGWNGRDFHKIASECQSEGTLYDLEELIDTDSFWLHDANILYPISGSFVSFLISKYGLDPIWDFCDKSRYHQGKLAIKRDFRKSFGTGIDEAWDEWLNFLVNY
jgi:hypothetical protein